VAELSPGAVGAPSPDSGAARPAGVRRAAAVLALLTLAGAGLIVVVGLFDNLSALLTGLAAVVVLVAGGWYAISRRGPVRLAGLVTVAAGVVLLVVAVVAADLSWRRALAAALLGGVSWAAAGVALGAPGVASAPPGGRAEPMPRAARPVLIMNLKSGGGKAERFRLVEECTRRGIEPVVLQPGDDLRQLAEDAIGRGADVLGMAGGDGSQALVADVASRHDVAHVCVPAGTRNHFALDLGLDRDDVVGALDAFTDGVERRVDLATVNGRVFVNNASLGLYAVIVQSPDYRDAKRRTAADMLPDLIGPDAPPLDLRYAGPDGEEHTTAHVILVSNDPYRLDDLGGRGTRERMDLGVLGIVTAHLAGAADAEAFVALNAAGQVRRFHGWREWTAAGFRVDSAAPIHVGVDGEALTLDPPLVFESVPRALRVRLPAHAPGLTRPARRRPASIPSELVRVAASG
jgi:diacylglycerol kinase family enzyme